MLRKRILYISLLVLLAGCSSAPPAQTEPTAMIFDVPPVYTATIPGVPSPAVTATPTISFPESLSTEQLHQRLDPLTALPDGCVLPCYNGLVMGQSGVYEVYNFYAGLGIGIPDMIPGDFQAVQSTGSGRLGAWLTRTNDAIQASQSGLQAPQVSIFVANNIAETMYVSWQYYPSYLTVPQILDQLGEPESLRLALIFDEDPPVYLLEMLYPDRQIGFGFYGKTIGDLSVRQVCLSSEQVQASSMAIVAPGMTPMDDILYGDKLQPLTDALGITAVDFTTAMTGDGCIDVPAAVWPTWQSPSP